VIKIFTGSAPRIIAVLRNYNANALQRIFPGLISVTSVRFPGQAAGTVLNTTAGLFDHLLWVPDDTDNNPIALLQRAVPNITESIRLTRQLDSGYTVVFDGFSADTTNPDAVAFIGPITDGVLR